MVFGSIGVPGSSKCPSPAPGDESERKRGEAEKPFTTFSIGVGPGDAAHARVRSRTVSSGIGSELRVGSGAEEVEGKVIDLTDSKESRWEFGTVAAALSGVSDEATAITEQRDDGGYELPPVLSTIAGFGSPAQALGHSPHQHPHTLGIHSGPGTPLDQVRPHVLLNGAAHDEFEVKDFGYGFGPVSGTGFAETITRAERAQRQREHEQEQERIRLFRESQERETLLLEEREIRDQGRSTDFEGGKAARDTDGPGRSSSNSRRGGGYYSGSDRGGGGGFGGRRGRGSNGFGRGYGRRGGGGGGYQQQQSRNPPPFNVTPPQAHFQPLMPMGEPLNGLYPPQRQQLTTYIPTGFEGYPQPPPPPPPLNVTAPAQVTPPVPMPISPISFPLDPTRWYLLGQLEYYLSPQNMAQDFFLRQRVSLCIGARTQLI